jgi:hypothetical protein
LIYKPAYILACIFLLSACDSQTKVVDAQYSRNPIIDIPTYKDGPNKGHTSYLYKVVKRDAVALKLDYLEHGFDSLQVRIWLGHSMAIRKNVVVLKYSNKSWSCQLLGFTYGHAAKTEEEFIATSEIKVLTPKSGWDSLIRQLISLQILTLPDDEKLTGYNGCGEDGLPYYFEVATINKYRFYKYCNIEENKGKFEEAVDVDKIANLLEAEFSFTYTK